MVPFFVGALDIRLHPIGKAKQEIKNEYIAALTFIVQKALNEEELQRKKLSLLFRRRAELRQQLRGENDSVVTDEQHQLIAALENIANKKIDDQEKCSIYVRKCISARLGVYQQEFLPKRMRLKNDKIQAASVAAFTKSWRKKYRYALMCDIALILLDQTLIDYAVTVLKDNITKKQKEEITEIVSLLYSKQEIEEQFIRVAGLIEQFRTNHNFLMERERKVIVTANMSAGKSTLINALVGKAIARTSQEVCTGNVCYLFNKPYEDGTIHLLTREINMKATDDDLHGYDWNEGIFIASFFATMASDYPRLCLVDTPGVDAALHKEHSCCAHNALLSDDYDIAIYVVSPTRLGTEAEKKHLQWVAQNLPKEKIIFVLNKLDNYHDFSDSIEDSVRGFEKDLLDIGFEKPVICPISAYFSYLLKLKMTGQVLNDDEEDEYALYSKKFKRAAYDLSHYYEGVKCCDTDLEILSLSKRVGLYGLEKIIYGGSL